MSVSVRKQWCVVFVPLLGALAGCSGASATVPDPTLEETIASEPAPGDPSAPRPSESDAPAVAAPEPVGGAGGSAPSPETSSPVPGSDGSGGTGGASAPAPPPAIQPLVGLVLAGATRSVTMSGESAPHASTVGIAETAVRAWPSAPPDERESIVLRIPTGTGTFSCSSGASVTYVREKTFAGAIDAKEEYVADSNSGSCSVTVVRSDGAAVEGTITGQIVRGTVIQKTIAIEMTFLVPRS